MKDFTTIKMKPTRLCPLTVFHSLLVALLLIAFAQPLSAIVPVAPDPVTITQPDGFTFKAFPKGNSLADWLETEEGYSITKNADGAWAYAVLQANGKLSPGPILVQFATPAQKSTLLRSLRPAADPESARLLQLLPEPISNASKTTLRQIPLLVLLIDFTNISVVYPDSSFEELSFGETASINSVYHANTFGQIQYVPAAETFGTANDGVIHVSVPMAHPNFGSTFSNSLRQTLLNNALGAAEAYFNLASFDVNNNKTITGSELSIMFITAGYESSYGGLTNSKQPYVWGHVSSHIYTSPTFGNYTLRYSMFGERHSQVNQPEDRICTIGIMCHELGHLTYDLPDLYDTDLSSYGIGSWCMMSYGSWGRTTFSGDSPVSFTAWCRQRMGVLNPQNIGTTEETIVFPPLNESPSGARRIWIDPYKINEYFLLENRQKTGFDSATPGSGLLITHIDNRVGQSNATDARRLVDVEEADGLNSLDLNTSAGDAGDVFPGSTLNRSFGNSTNPSSKSNDQIGEDFVSSGIELTNIVSEGETISLSVEGLPSQNDHITYLDGVSRVYLSFGQTTGWSAMRFTLPVNSVYNRIDGFQIYVNDASGMTIEAFLYEKMENGLPVNLLYSAGTYSAINRNFYRLFFDTRQQIAPGDTRVLVLKQTLNFNTNPIAIESNGTISGNCFASSSLTSTFNPSNDFYQYVLLSTVPPENDRWIFF